MVQKTVQIIGVRLNRAGFLPQTPCVRALCLPPEQALEDLVLCVSLVLGDDVFVPYFPWTPAALDRTWKGHPLQNEIFPTL